MVAQIDEQQLAVVALAMDPARKAYGLAYVLPSEQIACMSSVAVCHYLVRVGPHPHALPSLTLRILK